MRNCKEPLDLFQHLQSGQIVAGAIDKQGRYSLKTDEGRYIPYTRLQVAIGADEKPLFLSVTTDPSGIALNPEATLLMSELEYFSQTSCPPHLLPAIAACRRLLNPTRFGKFAATNMRNLGIDGGQQAFTKTAHIEIEKQEADKSNLFRTLRLLLHKEAEADLSGDPVDLNGHPLESIAMADLLRCSDHGQACELIRLRGLLHGLRKRPNKDNEALLSARPIPEPPAKPEAPKPRPRPPVEPRDPYANQQIR